MPSVKEKIRLCSNLLREPQVFDQLGDLAGGIARDLVLYGIMADTEETVLHLPDFCKKMGYNRQLLMKVMTDEQKDWLFDHGFSAKAVEVARVAIGYVLLRMGAQTLHFAEEVKRKDDAGKKSLRFKFKNIISEVDINILSTGTLLYYKIDKDVLDNSRGRHYQTLDIADYLSFKTPAGRADHQARKMYLRLVWKRRYWDKTPKREGYYPSQDNYGELTAVAGLSFKEEKQNATRLRKLLERVAKAGSIKMTPSVKLDPVSGEYKVTWKRDPLPNAAISDSRTAKMTAHRAQV